MLADPSPAEAALIDKPTRVSNVINLVFIILLASTVDAKKNIIYDYIKKSNFFKNRLPGFLIAGTL